MARILIDNEWYDQLTQANFGEDNYENLIYQRADVLFPDYYMVPFKINVSDSYDTKRADLVLIEKEYREWWVVEVELSHHSLVNHVIPQIEVLSRGDYNFSHADYIAERVAYLDKQRLRTMILGDQPRTLLILDRSAPEWQSALARFRTIVCVIEFFRSELSSKYLCRLNGQSPKANRSILTRCRINNAMPFMLDIDAPGTLVDEARTSISLAYGEQLTKWQVVRLKDSIKFRFTGNVNPLEKNIDYAIVDRQDRFELIKLSL